MNRFRERNTGWGRDRFRGEVAKRDRASIREAPRRDYAGDKERVQQFHTVSNWMDHKDITSFYFTRFGEDITENELWHHFKKWGDVREIFIPNRRNYIGRRYGFVRFKGARDIPYLARQLDRIVIGGMKLYVNIPKHGREMPRKAVTGTKPQGHEESTQIKADRARQARQTNPVSYMDTLTRNNRAPGQRLALNSQTHSRETSTSSIHINIGTRRHQMAEVCVGRVPKKPSYV